MSETRPLPSRPNIEFERKEAKALLKQLHSGDIAALNRARARHNTIDFRNPESIQLADAQLVIAREYGFTSWPKLLRYFGDVHRQTRRIETGNRQVHSTKFYIESVSGLLRGHANKRTMSARTLGAYVPRFYGMNLNEVLASSVTENEAQLAVARNSGYASWEALIEVTKQEKPRASVPWSEDPLQLASNAMDTFDLSALQKIVEGHPELLKPAYDSARGATLIRFALGRERQHGREAMEPILSWLETRGMSVQHELNLQLCGHMYMNPDDVRYLIERGADPNWIAPNGHSVLEHALVRYWSAEAIDVLAAHVVPPKALWISAALGDVKGVREFLDRNGKPKAAAQDNRPDFNAIGYVGIPPLPDADDEEILTEAFALAVLNSRVNVLDYMISRGFPVNTLLWEMPMVAMAAGNGWEPVVESLVRGGADVNLRGSYNGSAREMALEMLLNQPPNADRRRIAELCGIDVEAVLAEHNARPLSTPKIAPQLQQVLELANDDTARRGQHEVINENLLFGMLRYGKMGMTYFCNASRMDFLKFREDVLSRVGAGEARIEHDPLPLSAEAQATIDDATAIAAEHRRETVNELHLLYALTRHKKGIAADLLVHYKSSAAKLNEELLKVI